MGYSVKWVEDNLGISRDMIRYYEEKNLMPKNPKNKYRDYNEEDIERIWGIKLLIDIGFSTNQIYALMNDPKFDFDEAITEKVAELELQHNECVLHLEFAKSIKVTGRIPTTSNVGGTKFKDFIAFAREKYNICNESRMTPLVKVTDMFISKDTKELSTDDVEKIKELFNDFDIAQNMFLGVLYGYYQVISGMQEFGYDSDAVQKIVLLLHKYLLENNIFPEFDGKITTQFIGNYIASNFLCGDIARLHEQQYGKKGCLFIAKALAYYGKVDFDKL